MKNRSLPLATLFILGLFLIYGFVKNNESTRNTDLPYGYNTLFATSGECLMCHNAIEDNLGEPMGILDDWRSTMMANAAKDPLWRAKVSHEVIVNPGLQQAIEDKCTRCHAPAANWDAHHNGQSTYSIAELELDTMARDGVNCTVCHQIPSSSLGNISGNFDINDQAEVYGPYEAPFTNPMFNHTGYTATHAPHINDSKLCASCHTLITHSVDYNGTLTGNDFVEQAIYHEWLNSDFSQNGTSCQDCHIPQNETPVVISSNPPWFDDERTPFGKHVLAGGNVFMLKLLKQFTNELGITATSANFDTTIARTEEMLYERTLELEITEQSRTIDTLFINVELSNMTGHKFPGGFPSRRVFVELIAETATNDTIFHSGKLNSNYDLINEVSGIEPHYNTINNPQQVQIYEMVMGDYQGIPTTVLMYADHQLKDNRLVPSGFSNGHNSYDTVKIVGNASTDPDFNHSNGIEGSGNDIIHYNIPLNNLQEDLNITAKVHYQTSSGKWLAEMFSHSSTEIDTFKYFYKNADITPIIVASKSLLSSAIGIENAAPMEQFIIYPNPVKHTLYIKHLKNNIEAVRWFNNSGAPMQHEVSYDNNVATSRIAMNTPKGVYIIEVSSASETYRSRILVL